MKHWQLALDDDEVALVADAFYFAQQFLESKSQDRRFPLEGRSAFKVEAERFGAFLEARAAPLVEMMNQGRRPGEEAKAPEHAPPDNPDGPLEPVHRYIEDAQRAGRCVRCGLTKRARCHR